MDDLPDAAGPSAVADEGGSERKARMAVMVGLTYLNWVKTAAVLALAYLQLDQGSRGAWQGSSGQTLWSSYGSDGLPGWPRVAGVVRYPAARADPAERRNQPSGAENSRGIALPKGGSRDNARRSKPEHGAS